MSTPRFSILTPAHNHGPFIAATIASAQAQTVEDWELLVLDDGSTDETTLLAEAVGDPRIKVLREPHRGIEGLAATYNIGLEMARAPLIAILEGDDLWVPDKLERQLPDFEDPRVVLSAGRMRIATAGREDQVSPRVLPTKEVLRNTPVGRAGLEMLKPLVLTFTFAVTVVMRKAALERIGGFRQPPCLPVVDYPTFLRLSLEGEWRFHPEVLGIWRRHGGSTTLSRFPEIFEGCARHAAEFSSEFGSRLGGDLAAIEREWRQMQSLRLELAGRMRAAERGSASGSPYFRRAMRVSPHAKTRALLGAALCASRLGMSPEPIFRAAGREAWQSLSRISESDPLVNPDMPPEAYEIWPFTIVREGGSASPR